MQIDGSYNEKQITFFKKFITPLDDIKLVDN